MHNHTFNKKKELLLAGLLLVSISACYADEIIANGAVYPAVVEDTEESEEAKLTAPAEPSFRL